MRLYDNELCACFVSVLVIVTLLLFVILVIIVCSIGNALRVIATTYGSCESLRLNDSFLHAMKDLHLAIVGVSLHSWPHYHSDSVSEFNAQMVRGSSTSEMYICGCSTQDDPLQLDSCNSNNGSALIVDTGISNSGNAIPERKPQIVWGSNTSESYTYGYCAYDGPMPTNVKKRRKSTRLCGRGAPEAPI